MSAPWDVIAFSYEGAAYCPECAGAMWPADVLAGDVDYVAYAIEHGDDMPAPVFRDMLTDADEPLTCSGVRPGDAHAIIVADA